jgi:Dolichyl-phosphate-mannose-protein mannosyltransferase
MEPCDGSSPESCCREPSVPSGGIVSARVAVEAVSTGRRARVGLNAALAVEGLVLIGLLWLALAVRLTGLADHTDVSDEGIRGVQLRLLAAGFRPVAEIYASQGPLSLWLFYPAVALFGPEIVVARLSVVVSSMIVLAGSVWIARLTAGPIAGIAAGAILAVGPVFLDNSRLAFVEVPSIAPTILAIVGLIRFRQSGCRAWLVASALLMAIGALAKPMAAVAGLPASLLILAPRVSVETGAVPVRPTRRRAVDLGLFTLTGLIVCCVVIAMVGPTTLYDQLVAYRLGARAVRGWDLMSNAALVSTQLRLHGWGVLLAAAIGVVVALLRGGWLGFALVAWLLGALAALMLYSPLWDKHVTYAMPPLAILAGVGISPVSMLLTRSQSWRRLLLGLPAVIAVALIVAHLPTLTLGTRAIVYRHAGSDLGRYADDLVIVSAATTPGEFVVIDDAYLSMLTGRLTPPFLADLSWNRILARALTAEQAIAETRRYDSQILILQDDHLGQVQRYLTWADREYVLVKSYVQRRPARFRRVYAHSDVDLTSVRDALRATLASPTDVRIGPARLLGFELQQREIKPGSRVDLTLMFEALEDRPPEHALITRLRDRSGEAAWEGEWNVGDGAQEMHTWAAGRWQAQTLRLLVDDVPEGGYTLTVALQRPNGNAARVDARLGARAWGGDEVDLGEVLVVR